MLLIFIDPKIRANACTGVHCHFSM